MTVTAELVKTLRERTGAGMMDCKKALVETNADLEAAVDLLRKKGLASAAKKSGRVAAEGLVAAVSSGVSGVLVELNSETDFVAKNAQFQGLLEGLANDFLNFPKDDVEAFANSNCSKGKSVNDEIAENIAVIGENIKLRRVKKLSVSNGAVVTYVHNATTPTMGKIGVLVALESDLNPSLLSAIGKQIAMHIAATKPEALNVESLDASLVERERALLIDQARSSGKPEAVIEKMIEGRIVKFYEQVVLLEQLFIMDGKTKISELLQSFGKDNSGSVKIKDYCYFVLGEGVEKQSANFADEVTSMIK